MKKTKKSAFFLTLIITFGMIGMFSITPGVVGTTSIDQEPNFEWGFNINDFLGIKIEEIDGPLEGQTRFLGYNISASSSTFASAWWFENLTLTSMKFNSTSGNIENTDDLLIYALNTSVPIFMISSDPQESTPMIVPYLVLPVNTSDTLNLTYWGQILTSAFNSGYNFSYKLDEYSVDGNELSVFNSSTGHYINATYDLSNGTLISAESKVLMNFGGEYTVEQKYSRFYDPDKINPIAGTVLSPIVGDSLIYKKGNPTAGWVFASHNVTWAGVTESEYMGQPKTVRQVNATRYHWDILTEEWEIDEDYWDEDEGENGEWIDAFINKSIGGGNDEGHLAGMYEEMFNLVYPVGWTGDDLNSTYYLPYSSMMGLGESEVGSNWLKLANSSTNVWVYFEIDTSTGLLTNFTMSFPQGEQMFINSSLDELPLKGTSPFNYPSTGGLIYEVFSGETTMGVSYGSFNVTGVEFTQLEDSGIYAWVVNGTKYDWDKHTSSWVESDNEGVNVAIGAANGVQNYQIMDGIINMMWGEGSTGDDIDNAYHAMYFDYFEMFDDVIITANSTLYTNSTSNDMLYLELFPNGNVYNFTFHGDMGDGYMEMKAILIDELPDSAYPHVPDAPVLITTSQTITTDHLLIEWDAAEGANSYTLIVDGTPVLTDTGDIYHNYTFAGNGTYIITVTAKNEDGESVASDPITITVEIPPVDVPPDDNGDDNGNGFEIPGYDTGIVLLMIIFGIGCTMVLRKHKKL